ncbi:MAG: hypothetical protein RB191_21585 [Terriglobia bacterium]|nr:hypothetical protein [Terriglobia bacterium]
MPDRRPFPGIRFLVLVFVACVLSPAAHASDPRNVDASSFGQQDDITVLSVMRAAYMEAASA